MSSINNEKIAYIMLTNDGIYPGDPQVGAIYSYVNIFNNEPTFKIIYKYEMDIQIDEFRSSPYCHNIKLLWQYATGLTSEGLNFIDKYRKEHPNE